MVYSYRGRSELGVVMIDTQIMFRNDLREDSRSWKRERCITYNGHGRLGKQFICEKN